MKKLNDPILRCNHSPKKFKLNFDGGVLGHYSLELCNSCYVAQDKKFLISEERLKLTLQELGGD